MAPHGIAVEGSRSGDKPIELDKHMFFAGEVDGVPGSFVYLAMFPDFASGFIELPQPGTELPLRLMVAPDNLDNPTPTMIVFAENDVPKDRAPALCGTGEAYNLRPHELEELRDRTFGGKHPVATPQSEPMLVAQIAIECDDDFYRVHSSSLSRAANYALAIMGATSAVYQRDIRVALEVPLLRIWPNATNPFPGPNDGDLLGQIRNHWETTMQGFPRTSAILMTSYRGGVAWVGTMCGGYGYAMAGEGGNFNFPATAYVWDIDVTGHELGHNFGSPHTHSCFWAPAVDSCFNAEGGCFPTPITRPGTIMSYCHLSVGTVLKFHPRIATFIRAAAANYACVTPAPGKVTHDVATVQIVRPANGASVLRNEGFAPVAIVRNLGQTTEANTSLLCRITNAAGQEVYADTKPAPSMNPGAGATVSFRNAMLADTGLYQIAVTATAADDSATVNNVLSRPFQVLPTAPNATLRLTSPNGDETYAADSTVVITWTQTNVRDVTIELSTDNGVSWRTVRWSQPGDSGRYVWKVPATPTTQALIRLVNTTDSRIADGSDRTFTIALDYDAAMLEFTRPRFNDTIATPFTPRVEIRNNGARPLEGVPVRLKLTWRAGDIGVYDRTVTVPVLAPLETRVIDFPPTGILPEGNLVMVARTGALGDRNPANDSLSRTAEVTVGLSPPSMLVANGLHRAATLTWPASTSANIDAYTVYRGPDPEAMRPIATVRPTVLTYVDAPIANDSVYYYAVTAVRDSLESVYSPIASADPVYQIAGDTLRTPLLLNPANDARDVPIPAALVWRTVRGAELYQVQIAADANCADVIANYLSAEPVPLLPEATTFSSRYYWRVRAFNNSSLGPWSSVWNFTTGQNCAGTAVEFAGGTDAVLDTSFTWQGGPVTVEFWNYVKATELRPSSVFGAGYQDNPSNRFQAHVPWNDRVVYWDYGNIEKDTGRISAFYGPYLDKWTHVALVSNGRNFKAIYFDGELVASSNTIADEPTRLDTLRIGSTAFGLFPFKGKVDEFRIWDRVRSQAEIRRDMGRAIDVQPGLVVRYRFDEGSGTTTSSLNPPAAQLLQGVAWTPSGASISCVRSADAGAPTLIAPAQESTIPVSPFTLFRWSAVAGASAYQLEIATDAAFTDPATIQNIGNTWQTYGALKADGAYFWRVRAMGVNGPGAWSANGRFSTAPPCAENALVLDGNGAYVDIPTFEWKSRAVTLECWLFVDSADVRDSWLFYTGPADSAVRLASHAPWSNRKLVFDYGAYGSNGRIEVDYAPHVGKWTHVALVSNGKSFKAIYLDGKLAGSAAVARRPAGPRTGLAIGGNRNGTRFFKAKLTEFRIWNTARSGGAIRENMYRRLNGQQSGLVGYWRFDGAADSIVADASGFGADAILRNAPTWQPATPLITAAAPAINGPIKVLRNTPAHVYAVADSSGGAYQWEALGGTITAGQSTPSITVDWGAGPEGLVTVTTTRAGCTLTGALAVAVTDGTGVALPGIANEASIDVRPNPASSTLDIPIVLPRSMRIAVTLYDTRGEFVGRVADGVFNAGPTTLRWDASALPSGAYAVVLTTPDGTKSRIVTIVR